MYTYKEKELNKKLNKKYEEGKCISAIQRKLSPHVESAKREFDDVSKREKFFTRIPDAAGAEVAIKALLRQQAVTDQEAQGVGLAYRVNPRRRQFPAVDLTGDTQEAIGNRQGMKNFLEGKTMSDIELVEDAYQVKSKSLPVGEYTFVLNDHTFTIAPNSGSSKFVHPMLLGGWTYVDSAGTLEIKDDHIRVTKDSGHYRPTDTELEAARQSLAAMFGDMKQGRKKHGNYKKVRHNPQ